MPRIPNRQKDILFDSLIQGLDQGTQEALKAMYFKSNLYDETNHNRELEALKKEIKQETAEYVLNHIKATVDISEVLQQIEELRKAIESLGK